MADAVAGAGHGPSLRIDKYLWFARLSKSRSIAQKLAEEGHIRLNGRRIDRAHAPVRAGDLITFPHIESVRVVRVLALPVRRAPAPEAQSCYEELTIGS
ncbi:RNA-binding S4 domain-containing protein [uncultured Sphingobium sp.]|uniref:RNA-binding S4 domain-containing protein n=1 Tax=uncultured Sphingobium sp. TaxID=316087 RepID=UPI00260AB303|nr:RNA-binding S4 domain-containing protein [uncultured Sphingobium sp.]